jgi:hypothetical protein
MNPEPWMIERVFLRTKGDEMLFKQWTADLPIREDTTPFHSGSHSIRQFRAALLVMGRNNFLNVLEVGFCLGHSARIFFGLGADAVTSIDNSPRRLTQIGAEVVKRTHPHGFEFIAGDTLKNPEPLELHLRGRRFDLMFVDGNHNRDGVDADIALGLKLKIRHFLFDDFYPQWGPGVLPAIEAAKLVPLASFGTMMLCVTPENYLK